MNKKEILHSLALFDEKAEKLEQLSFVKTVFNYDSGVSIKINRRDDGLYDLTQERRGPLNEAIEAFVLTFRFFIQDNEPSSFRNLEKVYHAELIDQKLKDEFISIRKQINKFLDSGPAFGVTINDELVTRRRIFDTIIYGGLSHANHKKKKEYDFWMKGPLKGLIENEFVCTLAILFKAIRGICDINKKVILGLNISNNKKTI